MFGVSLFRQHTALNEGLRLISSGFAAPMSKQDQWWAIIAVASLITCLGYLFDFNEPIIHMKRPLAAYYQLRGGGSDVVRQRVRIEGELSPQTYAQSKAIVEYIWVIERLLLGIVAIYGAVHLPDNAIWYVILAIFAGCGLWPNDGSSFALIVFILVPRWTIWLLMVHRAPVGALGAYCFCELLFLLPLFWRAANGTPISLE